MGSAGTAALKAARRRVKIRGQLATTPGRLRLAVVALTFGSIAFGLVVATAAGTRSRAVDDVKTTESLLVRAVDVSASLSDAHAIAAFSFLVGGTEPASSRERYKRELRDAAVGLSELAGEIGGPSGSGPALRGITERLTVYSGLIDSARANQRQGFPVGGAYLRRAAKEMREQMLPRAGALYEIQAGDLIAAYREGVSGSTWLAVVLAGCGMLALLAATQIYIARTSKRIVNPPLAIATVILVGLMTWVVVAFAIEQNQLSKAQSNGSDPVELLTATSILASRAQANESVGLSSRGGGAGEIRLSDVDRGFIAAVNPIGDTSTPSARGSGGLLDVAISKTGHPTAAIDAIYAAYRSYRERHGAVFTLERAGRFDEAVDLATATSGSSNAAAEELNAALSNEVDAAQERFATEADRAGIHARGARRRHPGAHEPVRRAGAARRAQAAGGVPMMGSRGLLALSCACVVALGGCASVSDDAQDRSLAALKTPEPGALPDLPPLEGTPACERDPLRSVKPSALPAPGRMPAGSFMDKVQRSGRLVVGVDQNSLGLGYFDPATEEMEGFDIEVARKVAQAIFGGDDPDDHIRYIAISTQQRVAAISDRKVDIVASAFSINCSRQRRVRFSVPYHRARQRLLVLEDSGVDSLADLQDQRVCATSASTTVASLEGTGVIPYRVELRSDCLAALQERDVAAVTSDDAILLGLCRQDPQTKIVGPTIKDVQYYGLAMDRRRVGFARFVNAVLERTNLDALRERWLGAVETRSDDPIRRCEIPGT